MLYQRFVIIFVVDGLNDDAVHPQRNEVVDRFGFFLRIVHRIFEYHVVAVLRRGAFHRGQNTQTERIRHVAEDKAYRILFWMRGNAFHKGAAPAVREIKPSLRRSCMAFCTVMRET